MEDANILITACVCAKTATIKLRMHNQFLISKHKVVINKTVKILISNFLIYFPSILKKNNNQVDEYIKFIINSNKYFFALNIREQSLFHLMHLLINP